MGQVTICVLGPIGLRSEGGVLKEVTGHCQRALLASLVIAGPGDGVTPHQAFEAIWFGHPEPQSGERAVRPVASRLRRELRGIASVDFEFGRYHLNLSDGTVDAWVFSELVDHCRFAEALERWSGEPFAGLDGPSFAIERRHLEEQHLTALEETLERRLGESGPAIVADLTSLVECYPLSERLLIHLATALHLQQRDTEALRVIHRYEVEVLADVGLSAGAELRAVESRILSERESATNGHSSIPDEITTFFGREQDVQVLLDLVADRRLISIVGPGGVGKTRLALEVARRLERDKEGNVRYWPVDGLTDPRTLADALLGEMGLVAGSHSFDGVVAALEGWDGVLVIDNAEHLLPGLATFCNDLLGRCPVLRIMLTSRIVLGVEGEQLWPVEPLSESDAKKLFVDRLRAVRPRLEITPELTDRIKTICDALDRLPLPIELAVGRLRDLSFDELESAVRQTPVDLKRMSTPTSSRHASMDSAVDWSLGMLDNDESDALAQLTVFAGEFTSADAREVLSADHSVDAVLRRLIDRSLVQIVDVLDGPMRCRLLATTRQRAHSLVHDRESAEARHLMWIHRFLAGLLVVSIQDFGSKHRELHRRWADIRLAVERELARGQSDLLLELVESQRSAVAGRPYLEVVDWIERALEFDRSEQLICRLRAVVPTFHALLDKDRIASLFRSVGADPEPYGMGDIAWVERRSRRLGLDLDRATDGRARLQLLSALAGCATVSGDVTRAAAYALEGVALARELDDGAMLFWLHHQVLYAASAVDVVAVRQSLAEAQHMADEGGLLAGRAYTDGMHFGGGLPMWSPREILDSFVDCAPRFLAAHAIGSPLQTMVHAVAWSCAELGAFEQAAVLAGAVSLHPCHPPPFGVAKLEAACDESRAVLGRPQFQALFDQGEALSAADSGRTAVGFAREILATTE